MIPLAYQIHKLCVSFDSGIFLLCSSVQWSGEMSLTDRSVCLLLPDGDPLSLPGSPLLLLSLGQN